MRRPSSDCPNCGRRLTQRTVRIDQSFRCPFCSAELSVPRFYTKWRVLISIVGAVGVARLALPFTSPLFPLTWIAAFFLVGFVVAVLSGLFLPPQPRLGSPPAGEHLTVLHLESPRQSSGKDASRKG